MRSGKTLLLGLCTTFGIGCLIYAADPNAKHQKQAPVKINAEDLCSGRYVIVGRLGRPYGHIVKIRAVWTRSDDFRDLNDRLRVTHIDGREVGKQAPIVFVSPDVRRLRKSNDGYRILATRIDLIPKEGTVYEGRVYESGGYDVQPEEVEKIFVPLSQHLAFGFRSWLFLID